MRETVDSDQIQTLSAVRQITRKEVQEARLDVEASRKKEIEQDLISELVRSGAITFTRHETEEHISIFAKLTVLFDDPATGRAAIGG